MGRVKLKAGLPVGDANGLLHHADAFIDDPERLRVAVVVLDTKSTTEDRDIADITATVRVRRIEVITDPADVEKAQHIALAANEGRTGKSPLPGIDGQAAGDITIGQLFADWASTPLKNGKAHEE